MFRELRDVFKLMNHKDANQNFKREIKLFDRVVVRLTDLYNNEGKLPRGWNVDKDVSVLSDKEGGNYEQMQRLEGRDRKNLIDENAIDKRAARSLS